MRSVCAYLTWNQCLILSNNISATHECGWTYTHTHTHTASLDKSHNLLFPCHAEVIYFYLSELYFPLNISYLFIYFFPYNLTKDATRDETKWETFALWPQIKDAPLRIVPEKPDFWTQHLKQQFCFDEQRRAFNERDSVTFLCWERRRGPFGKHGGENSEADRHKAGVSSAGGGVPPARNLNQIRC